MHFVVDARVMTQNWNSWFISLIENHRIFVSIFSKRNFLKTKFLSMFKLVSIFSTLHKTVPISRSCVSRMSQRVIASSKTVAQNRDSWNSGMTSLYFRMIQNRFNNQRRDRQFTRRHNNLEPWFWWEKGKVFQLVFLYKYQPFYGQQH